VALGKIDDERESDMRPAHVLAIAIAALLAACGTGAEAEPATISATTTTGPASTTITTTTTSAATGDAADAGYDEEMEELSERYENDPEYRAEMDALGDAAIDSMYERELPATVTNSVESWFDGTSSIARISGRLSQPSTMSVAMVSTDPGRD
jgi:hypothetical protein